MTYEERRIEVCNKCTLHETCGFVLRNMDNKCSDLDDIMHGWELGQKDTLEEVERTISVSEGGWLESNLKKLIKELKG